jgi:23S rRNA pseudouridine1911/1915/1917 synthase
MQTLPISEKEILFEDNHLLVLNKRAGLATMGVESGEDSVVTLVKEFLRHKYDKPGNVYLGIVSRLDARVSGVIVLAKTSKAAARLTKQFKDRKTQKTYWTIVTANDPSEVIAPSGDLNDLMFKDEPAMRMRCVQQKSISLNRIPAGAKEARLSWKRIGISGQQQLLEINLHTGRKHQIRCQLANAGFPICGDRKYGSKASFRGEGIALHSKTLEITHPTLKIAQLFQAPVPERWKLARFNL